MPVFRSQHNSTELAQNGNNSSSTNPYEPLVSPAGLVSKARTLNDREGAPKTDPSQRPGAYTARGRAFGSHPAWHRGIMNAHLAASFRQGSRRTITAVSGNELPRSRSRRLSRCHLVEEEDNTEQIPPLSSRFPRSSSAHKRKSNRE